MRQCADQPHHRCLPAGHGHERVLQHGGKHLARGLDYKKTGRTTTGNKKITEEPGRQTWKVMLESKANTCQGINPQTSKKHMTDTDQWYKMLCKTRWHARMSLLPTHECVRKQKQLTSHWQREGNMQERSHAPRLSTLAGWRRLSKPTRNYQTTSVLEPTAYSTGTSACRENER